MPPSPILVASAALKEITQKLLTIYNECIEHIQLSFLKLSVPAAVKREDKTPEMLVRRLVHSLGYRYCLHVRALPGTPDLVFPRLRKIILVSGCLWHMHGCGRCRIPASRRGYWVRKLTRNAQRDRKNRR